MKRSTCWKSLSPGNGRIKLTPQTVYLIHDMTWEGRGVSRNPDGRVVMIAGALPGDSVSAEINPSSGRGPWFGTVTEVISPSSDRIPHPCTFHSHGCLGTPLGSWRYEAALTWKVHHLEQTLKRIGGLADPVISNPIASDQPWGYRERLELHPFQMAGQWGLGYLSAEGISPLTDCLLASAPLRQGLVSLTTALRPSPAPPSMQNPVRPAGRHAPRLLLRDNGHEGTVAILMIRESENRDLILFQNALRKVKFSGWQILQVPDMKARFFHSSVVEEEGGCRIFLKVGSDREIAIAPTVFSQVNHATAKHLVQRVLESLREPEDLLDIYGGYGAFALEYALNRNGKALVLEASPGAVQAGQQFAREHNLPVEYMTLDLSQHHPSAQALKNYQLAIIDPPRSGIHAQALGWLNEQGPGLLIYVSCHPATLARDLRLLTSYKPQSFTPVDLFPQTPDLETVTVLHRR
jgi:23S rRNA (uracil1939-C5)-methyltransferase